MTLEEIARKVLRNYLIRCHKTISADYPVIANMLPENAVDYLNTGLELYLKAKNNHHTKFCLLVANHAGFEMKGTADWKQAADLWIPFLTHKQHIRVDNKPLRIIFSPQGADKAGFEYLQDSARKAGLPGVAIAACNAGDPNSGLGEAIAYMRKHWNELTLFLRQPGAPLNNNVCERALKKAILHRKNAYFYKTQNGARVGDLFMSLIHTHSATLRAGSVN